MITECVIAREQLTANCGQTNINPRYHGDSDGWQQQSGHAVFSTVFGITQGL
ncbi:hypothetical protein ACKC9G_12605 [Pokkaliibacter sp. CJK22405]|uniref:hypothetical protein n=1 Tax=Pokkaliibacter sp. CJK22405 TaxID=3384615 RepID=UPI003984AB15